MAEESTIEGVDHLLAQLDRLTLVQGKQILAKALRRGPVLIAEEAERLAPRDTGRLAANIIVTVTEQTATEAIAKVGPARSAFYGQFSEFGTVKMPEQPFMEPAYQSKIDEAEAVIRYDLARLIEAQLTTSTK